jgi:hypothetical protein
MFAMVLPRRITPSNLSGFDTRRFTYWAFLSPVSAKYLSRKRLRAVKAVSDPEKKAESVRKKKRRAK